MDDNNQENISLDDLEALLIEGKQIRKEKIRIKQKTYNEIHKKEILAYQKAWRENNKEELATKHKVYKEQKAQELGFEDYAQRQRYNRWCKKNNIRVNLENPEYLEKIQYWLNNID